MYLLRVYSLEIDRETHASSCVCRLAAARAMAMAARWQAPHEHAASLNNFERPKARKGVPSMLDR